MDPIETKLIEFFEQNYQRLRLEGGHALTEDITEQARLQVLMYWRKLKTLIDKVSDSEVRLSLPNQKTSKGRIFSIEGVVDIVREGDVNEMYDIKTHDLDYINQNIELYEEQLNIYAHVWQELRKNKLDLTAIISTSFPNQLKVALRTNDASQIQKAMAKWEPVIPVEVHHDKVKATIQAFANVVDDIEDGAFPCPSVEKLQEKIPGKNEVFATTVCRNCDGRFSCESYRQYARSSVRGKARELVKYFESSLDKDEQDDWLEANSNFENENT